MQHIEKKMVLLILALLTVLFIVGCSSTTANPKELIQQMVTSYSRDPASSQNQVADCLRQIKKLDQNTYEQWQSIMNFWDCINTDPTVQQELLPETLPTDDTLCIIVLGYQLNPDGSMQNELIGRLETAKKCAAQYPNAYILCTGGGTAGRNKEATEAECMSQWLMGNGIAEERIIVEAKSLTTTQNAQYSAEILRKAYPMVSEIAIVTSDYHIPWAAVLFQTEFTLSEDSANVVSHAAFRVPEHPNYNILSIQRSGILELAGLQSRFIR